MENGTILEVMPWGAGRIEPKDGGETVIFTERVFKGNWQEASPGRKVKYQLYVGSKEAKEVVAA